MLAAWQITEAIGNANIGFTKLPLELLAAEGMSSTRGRILLNEICSFDGCRYLEVGTYKGSTVLAASYSNSGTFVSIDNFSEFGANQHLALANKQRWSEECRWDLVQADVWSIEPPLVPINVFFYDGKHTEADQRRAFTHFHAAFTHEFIAIVDDWNAPFVAPATWKAFQELGYQILFEKSLYSPHNLDAAGWWNGMYVALISKTGR